MGNKSKAKPKKNTFRAKSQRKKQSLKNEEACSTTDDENGDTNLEHCRVIMSTRAIEKLLQITVQHAKKCPDADLQVSAPNTSLLHILCTFCDQKFHVRKDSKEDHQLSIPEAIAAGALCSGIGYTSIKTVFASLEIPFIGGNTYRAAEENVGKKLEFAVEAEFKKAGELEKKLAEEAEDVLIIDGKSFPFNNVTADAGWGTRSYGHSYRSNTGVAVIIGSRTRKILWMDTRITTCSVCDKEHPPDKEDNQIIDDELGLEDNEDDSIESKPHICYKNWNKSPQAMEADIIVQGFLRSVDDHGLIYRYVTGDADSSVYGSIQSKVVYPGRTPVEKIDCINHAVRGLNSKICHIIKTTAYSKKDRDFIERHQNRFGKDARAAIAYNHEHQSRTENPTSAMTLSQDLINVPCHILGNHTKCKDYFCKNVEKTSAEYEQFKLTPAGKDLILAFHRLSNRSQRLIYNVTSNFAECFMGVMTKCISGKRINYGQRGSYTRRARSAVMAYNVGAFWLPYVISSEDKPAPKIWRETEKFFGRAKKTKKSNPNKSGPFKSKNSHKTTSDDQENYGPDSFQGNLSEAEMAMAIENLITSLQLSSEEIDKLQLATVGQAFNILWKTERRSRLTASNCARIFSLRDCTNNLSILKSLLYPTDLSKNENIKYGIDLEPEAKRLYSDLNDVEVTDCGLFVDKENGILAASPDGLIDEDGILEIKCITCPPNQVPLRKDNFLIRVDHTNPESELQLKRTHKYFYQILMQLYVTGRDYCDLFVYHKPKDDEENIDWHQERILKNEETAKIWEKVKQKLTKFYQEEVAPEICDPIFHRTGAFRIPAYRATAMNKFKTKSSNVKRN